MSIAPVFCKSLRRIKSNPLQLTLELSWEQTHLSTSLMEELFKHFPSVINLKDSVNGVIIAHNYQAICCLLL